MSRIGRQPVLIPEGVTVEIKDGQVYISGPKGKISINIRREIKVEVKDNQIFVRKVKNTPLAQSLWGTIRSLIANGIKGVTEEFSKTLKVVGTGYRVSQEGEGINLSVGFSHPVKINPPEGIKLAVEGNDTIKVSGVDKALVGQVAAEIRKVRPPDPYKGKGIRYEDEEVKLKPGKAGKAGAAGAGG